MKISLEGQVVLLTGGSRGIGEGIVKALGECGATVAIHYKKSKELAEKIALEIGNGSKAFPADLWNSDECRALFQTVLTHYGKVDCLINNAGIAIETKEDGDFEIWEEIWVETLKVNLLAPAVLAREAIIHFKKKRQGGRIIFISSRAAFRGDTPDFMAYAASKGGLVSLHRSIARGYGKDNIKSFLVAPGFIKTDMAQQFIEQYGEKYVLEDLALNELTLPKDLAPTVCFLASGWMDHATGCSIDVNAGSYVH